MQSKKMVLCLGVSLVISACNTEDVKEKLRGEESKEKTVDRYAESASALYSVVPDITNCKSGVLSDVEKQKALTIVNDIRQLHGLGSVTYDYSSDDQVMAASLIFAANGMTSHYPPVAWKCYSDIGAKGAGTSNITGGVISPYLKFYTTEDNIVDWLTDVNNKIADSVGHRRWLLDPFLTKIAFGKVAGRFDDKNATDGAAIKVIYDDYHSTTGKATTEIVAYPIGDYPAKYYAQGALLSFSVIASLDDRRRNSKVDFSTASIYMTQRGGGQIQIGKILYDNDSTGLANNLQFSAANLSQNVIYDVNIKDVKIDGVTKSYNYWFRVVQ